MGHKDSQGLDLLVQSINPYIHIHIDLICNIFHIMGHTNHLDTCRLGISF